MIVQQENFVHYIEDKLKGEVRNIESIRSNAGRRLYFGLLDLNGEEFPISIRFFLGVRGDGQIQNETHALRELSSDNYPVPEVLLTVDDNRVTDTPFLVMSYIPGEPLSKLGRRDPEHIQFWLERASDLLLRLHGLKWENGYDWLRPPLSPLAYSERMINWWSPQAAQLPADEDIRHGLEWLRAHLYLTRIIKQQCLVHRDFCPENLIAEGKKIVGVLDWGELRIADPAVDVGWTNMKLTTETTPELGKLFVGGYTRRNPDVRRTLPFWEMFAAVKRLIQLKAISTGNGERLGFWGGTSNFETILRAEPAVRQFLNERLTGDEDN